MHNLPVKRILRSLKCFAVKTYQLCIIIKHLFKVRGFPYRIGAVAGKAAAQLIIDAAI